MINLKHFHRLSIKEIDIEATIIELHKAFQRPIRLRIDRNISREELNLRINLIAEEYQELQDAIIFRKWPEIADAIGDMVVVLVGTAVQLGIPFNDVFAEIHRSNLTKLDENGKPILRADGKFLKSALFQPPDFSAILHFKEEETSKQKPQEPQSP